jgi:rhodanese-related sulfurtransferase
MTTTDPQSPATATITSGELVRMRTEDPAVHVIDVRMPGEFETGHIEGSYNVPLDLLGEHISDLAALDHDVVLVCQSGARATKALEQLVAAGKSNLRLLQGGMTAWTASGGHVARTNATRWAMDRQVRLVAGALVLASIVVSVWLPSARYVAGFVGAGLTFSAVTNTCGMAMALAKLPYNRGASCDVGAVLNQLTTTEAKA